MLYINNKLELFNVEDGVPKTASDIPIVVICWNNLTFVRNFVNQLKKYPNKIILVDNNSTYQPLHEYYQTLEIELGDKIEIKRLNENRGHTVYVDLQNELPDVFIISDPDLELHPSLPLDFSMILYDLSEKYKAYKVGSALDISDSDKFVTCNNYYSSGTTIHEFEMQYWNDVIPDDEYILYRAGIDTTLCLINPKYFTGGLIGNGIRVAGDFTVKHLPWYKNYIRDNFPQDEIDHWKTNNKTSSILTCL
jgi:hypothetical protein